MSAVTQSVADLAPRAPKKRRRKIKTIPSNGVRLSPVQQADRCEVCSCTLSATPRGTHQRCGVVETRAFVFSTYPGVLIVRICQSESAHFLCQYKVSGTLRPSPSWSVNCRYEVSTTFYERRCGAVEDSVFMSAVVKHHKHTIMHFECPISFYVLTASASVQSDDERSSNSEEKTTNTQERTKHVLQKRN